MSRRRERLAHGLFIFDSRYRPALEVWGDRVGENHAWEAMRCAAAQAFLFHGDPKLATRTERMWEHIRADRALRQIRKEKKDAPQEERVRRKDWTAQFAADVEAFDDLALPEVERIMPPGERERRRVGLARVAEPAATAARRPEIPRSIAASCRSCRRLRCRRDPWSPGRSPAAGGSGHDRRAGSAPVRPPGGR